jgi:hypothetical protein
MSAASALEALRGITGLSDSDFGLAYSLITGDDHGLIGLLGERPSKPAVEAYLQAKGGKGPVDAAALAQDGKALLDVVRPLPLSPNNPSSSLLR